MAEIENKMKVVEISPCSSEKVKRVIELSSPASSIEKKNDGTPLRPVFCLKRNIDMELFEKREDCFIHDFDPFEPTDNRDLSVSEKLHVDNYDLYITAEKGQVACRDYPHPRHLCVKFPFETTPHERHCELCYCYVCDLAAPCKFWTESEVEHCHASAHVDDWKQKRNLARVMLRN
ncbi:hypothetical protein Dsin_012826 [Dipteronia sinensis]|uniref:Uncharacterized protein n=1 Tax=Dipteronia sinensis TaxID=43782 RepID=A0AAE0E8E6_9ROSI|nr:hypothetical protein Dsin_012826 [Dipteronia sinensis]